MRNNTRGLDQFKANSLSDSQMNAVAGGFFSLNDLANFFGQAQKFIAATKTIDTTITYDKAKGTVAATGTRNGQSIVNNAFTLPPFLTNFLKGVTGLPTKVSVKSTDSTKPPVVTVG